MKSVEDHENRTFIIENAILIIMGTFEESIELKIEKPLTPEE